MSQQSILIEDMVNRRQFEFVVSPCGANCQLKIVDRDTNSAYGHSAYDFKPESARKLALLLNKMADEAERDYPTSAEVLIWPGDLRHKLKADILRTLKISGVRYLRFSNSQKVYRTYDLVRTYEHIAPFEYGPADKFWEFSSTPHHCTVDQLR